MKNKQTAVEWLIEQWPILESQLPPWLIDQAKAIEREQIEQAFRHGELFSADYYDGKNVNSQYYNQTYKGGNYE